MAASLGTYLSRVCNIVIPDIMKQLRRYIICPQQFVCRANKSSFLTSRDSILNLIPSRRANGILLYRRVICCFRDCQR